MKCISLINPSPGVSRLAPCVLMAVLLIAAVPALASAEHAWAMPFASDSRPVVDGIIDEAEWGHALRVVGLFADPNVLESRNATVWIRSDGDRLYLAMRSEIPPVGSLLARAQAVGDRNRPQVYYDDHIEIWLDPAPGTAASGVFRLAVNPRGAVYTAWVGRAPADANTLQAWRQGWTFASRITAGYWEWEAEFNLAAVGLSAADLRRGIGLELLRNWQQPRAASSLFAGHTAAKPSTIQRISWRDDGVVARMMSLREADGAGVHIALQMVNPGSIPVPVQLDVYQQASENPPFELDRNLVIPPGVVETIDVREAFRSGHCQSSIRVADGGTPLFQRIFAWDIERPSRLWTAADDGIHGARLDFGFYPYYQKLKARLDIAGLSMRDTLNPPLLRVNDAAGNRVAEAAFSDFADYQAEFIMDLPQLEAGIYEVSVDIIADGRSLGTLTDSFVREYFPWEHNTLGITNEVVPPFTPMAVVGSRVDTVLRSHEVNALGLWEQVISDDRPVLAGPIHLDVAIGGKPVAVELSEPLVFTETEAHRVSFNAAWRAGPLRGKIQGSHEFDGVLKVDLWLDQDGDETVDRLDLVIPLREDIAKLMHPVTTGTRRHYAGYVPAGEGLLWESKDAHRRALLGTFVPYIWIGDESRGIAWFAESDRDWMYDDVTSTHRVYREDNRVVLRVSFVTRPGALERPRHIVFGLQATPTKPMPEEPVHWRNWQQRADKRFVDRNYNIYFLAGSATWGTAGGPNFVYPRDRDYSIFELLRDTRETGQRDARREQAWLDGDDLDEAGLGSRRSHILWGLRAMATQPDAVVPYTNPRGAVVDPEFITFQDEWNSNAYASRRWTEPIRGSSSGGTYVMTPTRSFQDYEIWHFKKMLETFADAIYYDCLYLRQNHDLVTGAYLADDGTLRPAVDIWQLREYLRRIQTLTWQMGRNWLASMSHMTNTQIAPTNTWVGINLEWEIGYSMRTFQDRFSRDEIRATALGAQTGSVPQVLGTTGIRGDATPEHERRVRRSLAGVSAIHELKDIRSVGCVSGEVYGRLFDFGYGTPECRVIRYWDEDYPVTIEGLDAEALVMINDGAALLVVVDYGDGGEGVVRLDPRDLELQAGGRFVNLETGETLDSAGDHAFRLYLPKHDFMLIGYHYNP